MARIVLSTPEHLFIFGRHTRDYYVDARAYQAVIAATTTLIQSCPFWGICGMHLRKIEDTTGTIKTAATDGRNMWYNAKFVLDDLNTLGLKIFVIAHEISHVLRMHVGKLNRKGDRDDDVWGIATDLNINEDLLAAKVGGIDDQQYHAFRSKYYFNEKYRGWMSERIYDDLLKDAKAQAGMKGRKSFDQHIEIEIVEGEASNEITSNGTLKIQIDRETFEKLTKHWRDVIQQAAAVQKMAEERLGAGKLPLGIQRMIDELLEPRINWRTLLRRYTRQVTQHRYSWKRPNKALFNAGFTVPGYRTKMNELDIVVAVDTSGSIGKEQLTVFLSELSGMLKAFQLYNILGFCFEGTVIESTVTKITRIRGDVKDLGEFIGRIAGGGGTMFESIFEYLREKRKRPRLLIVLTDGHPNSTWGDPGFCPTLFMVFGSTNKAPFGKTIFYDADTKVA